MLKLKYCIALLALTIATCPEVFSQDMGASEPKPMMAEALRANGKIYVVVAVVVTIVIGLFLYLLRLDRKISKLEKGDTA